MVGVGATICNLKAFMQLETHSVTQLQMQGANSKKEQSAKLKVLLCPQLRYKVLHQSILGIFNLTIILNLVIILIIVINS